MSGNHIITLGTQCISTQGDQQSNLSVCPRIIMEEERKLCCRFTDAAAAPSSSLVPNFVNMQSPLAASLCYTKAKFPFFFFSFWRRFSTMSSSNEATEEADVVPQLLT